MPNDIVQKLNLVVNDILKKPAAREKIQADGAEPAEALALSFLKSSARDSDLGKGCQGYRHSAAIALHPDLYFVYEFCTACA
jgi:hypothetical protein